MDNLAISSPQKLVVYVSEESGWYRATCPELDVAGAGATKEQARQSLLECARMTAKYLMNLNGHGAGDPRRKYAELLVQHWNQPESLFLEV